MYRPPGFKNPYDAHFEVMPTAGEISTAVVHRPRNLSKYQVWEECTQALLKALRNQPESWCPNSAFLWKFCQKVPSPKGRLVFLPDDSEKRQTEPKSGK